MKERRRGGGGSGGGNFGSEEKGGGRTWQILSLMRAFLSTVLNDSKVFKFRREPGREKCCTGMLALLVSVSAAR